MAGGRKKQKKTKNENGKKNKKTKKNRKSKKNKKKTFKLCCPASLYILSVQSGLSVVCIALWPAKWAIGCMFAVLCTETKLLM